MPDDPRPEPFQLWEQARGDRDEYLRLLELHGHIVPAEPCVECGGMYPHRHDGGAIIKTDAFGHDLREP